MATLGELATTLRSKNAGVNQVTFDIIFPDRTTYERVVRSGSVTQSSIARLFNIAPETISDFITFDVANAIKFTLFREVPNGSPGDWDVLGCQQYGPLMDLEIP
jgi:hypothetical protein